MAYISNCLGPRIEIDFHIVLPQPTSPSAADKDPHSQERQSDATCHDPNGEEDGRSGDRYDAERESHF